MAYLNYYFPLNLQKAIKIKVIGAQFGAQEIRILVNSTSVISLILISTLSSSYYLLTCQKI